MPWPITVAPSLLSADYGRLGEEAVDATGADWIHIDVLGRRALDGPAPPARQALRARGAGGIVMSALHQKYLLARA